MSEFSTLLITAPEPGLRLVTLNRPAVLNALSYEMVEELRTALSLLGDDRNCSVIVVTGAGRAFCAGFDLAGSERSEVGAELGSVEERLAAQARIAGLVPLIRELPQPVVAAVNGPAVGGGFAIALAADIRVAGPSARFGVAFSKLGLSGCDIGVSYLLPRLIGSSRAFELMLTGRVIDAGEADRCGLLSALVEDGSELTAGLEMARAILANSGFGMRMTKQVMAANLDAADLRSAIELENRTQILATYTGDMEEAIRAFREKRNPNFARALRST